MAIKRHALAQSQCSISLRQMLLAIVRLAFILLCSKPVQSHFVAPGPSIDESRSLQARSTDSGFPLYSSWKESLTRRRHGKDKTHRHSRLISCLAKYNVEHISETSNSSEIYFEASQGENMRYHYMPVAITYAKSKHEVADIVRCAASHGNTQTVVRSGGHSFAGHSAGGRDGALIIDLRHMDDIHAEPDKGVAHIGPGAMLGDVIKQLYRHGKRATAHGTCPTVAVGGHALCGGVGPTSHRWGLMIDNLLEAEVVLANGSIVHASQHKNYDLWWALKGAGSFYGVVTNYTLQTYDASGPSTSIEYRWSRSLHTLDDAAELMMGVQTFALSLDLPDKLGFHVQVATPSTSRDGEEATIAMQLRGVYLGSLTEAQEVMSKLWLELKHRRPSIATPDMTLEKETDFVGVMKLWDDFGQGEKKLNTALERLKHVNFVHRSAMSMGRRGFSKASFTKILGRMWDIEVRRKEVYGVSKRDDGEDMDKLEQHPWGWNMYFELFGTANSRLNNEAVMAHSSFVNRDALWLMQASVGASATDTLIHDAYIFLDQLYGTMKRAMKQDGIPRRAFSCYTDPTLEDWKESYFGNALPRLIDIKRQVDPHNLFRTPQSLIETTEDGYEHVTGDTGDEDSGDKDDEEGTHGDDKPTGPEDIHPLPRSQQVYSTD